MDGSTKSGKWRAVPLTREAFVALYELSRREGFTGPDDFVFCGPAGDPIGDSALRRRFRLARDAAGLDPSTIQTLMGHSKITTTERYLHARPLVELAERMDAIFAVAPPMAERGEDRVTSRTLGHMGTVQVDIDGELLQRLRERHPGKSDRELIERLAIIDVGMAVLRENPRLDADPEDVVLEEAVRAVHEARAEME